MVTVAMPLTVSALGALNMPRVVKKLTVRPSGIFMPFLCHSTPHSIGCAQIEGSDRPGESIGVWYPKNKIITTDV